MTIYDDQQRRAEQEAFFKLAPETEVSIRTMKEQFSEFAATTYLRSYARKKKETAQMEAWHDTVLRTIDGLFYFKKKQALKAKLGWNDAKEQKLARKMAESMFRCEWLPPGRGLWAMQREYIEKYGSIALNNCAFVSTSCTLKEGEFMNESLADAAEFLMEVSMLGAGCGFDCRYKGKLTLPDVTSEPEVMVISDDREGWSKSLFRLLCSYMIPGSKRMVFDYSLIRKKGAPIKGFGGVAAGPEVLELLHNQVRSYSECRYRVQEGLMSAKDSIRISMFEELKYGSDYFKENFERILEAFEKTPEDQKTYAEARYVTDVMNATGICVISGNVRRSSEIGLGYANDEEFVDLKNRERNPERDHIGWMSNNSVMIEHEDQYEGVARMIVPRIMVNGEPGILNLAVANAVDAKNPNGCRCHLGVNPCGEIILMHKELCCLVEVFAPNCVDENGNFCMKRFLKVCKYAAIWASVVSCIPTHNKDIDAVVSRNHRIGVSQSGIFAMYDNMPEEEFDTMIRDAFAVVKTTSDKYVHDFCGTYPIAHTTIKPSGTVSILGQVPSGLHPPLGKYMMRRITIEKDRELADALIALGVPYEPSKYNRKDLLFEYPLTETRCRSAKLVPAGELMRFAVKMQKDWSDNGVSSSIYFKKGEGGQLYDLLMEALPNTKAISFASSDEVGYDQAPFTVITEEEYLARVQAMPKFTTEMLSKMCGDMDDTDGSDTKYCDSMRCSMA